MCVCVCVRSRYKILETDIISDGNPNVLRIDLISEWTGGGGLFGGLFHLKVVPQT